MLTAAHCLTRLFAVIATSFAVAASLHSFATVRASDVTDTGRSQFAKLKPVGLEEVQWTAGEPGAAFWADRVQTLRESSIPAMWEIMRGEKYKPYLQHFLIAAGEREGDYHGAAWNDGDFYKFLEAVSAANAAHPDPQLKSILEESIPAIAKAQRDDGYIHTPVLVRQRNGDESIQPFADRHNFEMYNMGHLITAACLHHRVTGSDEFLDIARKTADFLVEMFRDPTADLARNSVCPSHYMAMVELYRTTRDPRYLELAHKFLTMRGMVEDGGDDNQDRIPFVDQREAAGHAVRANYLYAGAADLFLETGDPTLWKPLDAIWQNVIEKKMYITGGCGALYDGASPDGSEDQAHITRIHQAYGRDYQLPNITAHNETCAAIGSMLWNWRMFLVTGEAKYVDTLELALYNAVLAGMSLDGDDYFYVNPLRQTDPLPTQLRWSRERVPFVTSYCCPPNVLRTIAELNAYAYSKSPDALWVNLYGASKLKTSLQGQTLELSQTTNYPWDGRVRIQIDQCPAKEFALKFRIPSWSNSPTLKAPNGNEPQPVKPGSYAEIRRRWKPGDVVELQLGIEPRVMESHPLVEETNGQIAIQAGPIVYCLESPDLPSGVRVRDVALARDAKLVSKFEPALLGGVNVIEADAIATVPADWNNQLYRPRAAAKESRFTARFIPYYAWSNRGPSEMTVWLPQ